MATCLPKDEFLVAFGDFLVIFYPGMRKNVDECCSGVAVFPHLVSVVILRANVEWST